MASTNTKSKPSTKSAADAAHERLTNVQTTVSSLTDELATLQQEHDEISGQIEVGSLVADVDRLAEIEELVGRRSARRDDLNNRVLVAAEHAVAAAELDELASDQAEGIAAKHDAYLAAVETARGKVAEGIEELKAATEAWETFSSPVIRRAASAGLTEDQTDPLARAVVAGTGAGRHLIIDGEPFTVPGVNVAIAEGVSAADEHLAGTIARGREARRWNLSVAQIGA